LVVDPAGEVLFFARFESSLTQCSVGNLSARDDRVAYQLVLPEHLAPLRGALSVAPLPDGMGGPWWHLPESEIGTSYIQQVVLGPDDLIALELAPALRVATVRDGVFAIVDSGGSADDPVVVDDTVFLAVRPGGFGQIHAESGERAVVPYIAPPATDSLNLRSNGRDLVWFEGSERVNSRTWMRRRIVTAPYTPDPSSLAPRTLYAYPGTGNMPWVDVGGDWAVVSTLEIPWGHLLIRISTGETFALEPPPEHQFRRPLYITDDEIALPVSGQGHIPELTIFKLALPPG
jgi:hypothetical protein